MDILLLVAIGFAAGTLGSLLGLGGGFLVVPALLLLRGMDERMATATSVAVIVPTMVVALWLRGGVHGQVDWRVAGVLAVGAIAGAVLGSSLSTWVPKVVIRRLFAGVLVGLAVLLLLRD